MGGISHSRNTLFNKYRAINYVHLECSVIMQDGAHKYGRRREIVKIPSLNFRVGRTGGISSSLHPRPHRKASGHSGVPRQLVCYTGHTPLHCQIVGTTSPVSRGSNDREESCWRYKPFLKCRASFDSEFD